MGFRDGRFTALPTSRHAHPLTLARVLCNLPSVRILQGCELTVVHCACTASCAYTQVLLHAKRFVSTQIGCVMHSAGADGQCWLQGQTDPSLQQPVDRGVDVAARCLQRTDVGLLVKEAHILVVGGGWGRETLVYAA